MQEFMRALQCFMYEFWDLETRPLDKLIADKEATEGLIGGWCVLLPERSRICHIRRCLESSSLQPSVYSSHLPLLGAHV